MNIIYDDERWQNNLPDIEELAYLALQFCKDSCSIVLANDDFVQKLNAQYRGMDKPTNILSFPDDSEEGYLGDMILAFETCEREAKEQNKTLADHYTHLLIHGALHLQGYDHMHDDQAEEMENREIALLAQLGIANPYKIS